MKKRVLVSFCSVMLVVLFSLSGCSEDDKSLTIRFGDSGWDSIRIHNAIAGFIAETAFDYKWEELPGSTPICYQGIIDGDIDVMTETWSDNIAAYKEGLSNGMFAELSVNFDDNNQGVYVPRYVIEGDSERGIEPMAPDLKTLADLKKYPDIFPDSENKSKGRLYGAIPGWEADDILRKRFENLGMGETFIYFSPGTDAALAAVLKDKYESGDPVAGYYWGPTWLTGMYDFVLLEDEPYFEEGFPEGKCAFPSVRVTVTVSNEFMEKAPEYCEFLSKYKTSSSLTAQALAYMQETSSDYLTTAKWFLKENPELLNEWLDEDRADKIKSVLAGK